MIEIGLIAAALVSASESQSNDLNLTCSGSGIAAINKSTSAYAHDNYGNSVVITGNSSTAVNYTSTTDFKMANGEATIRLPRIILPSIRGGENGWFKIKKLQVTPSEITGKAAVNFLNNPEFTINRLSGTISISAKRGSFFGNCQALSIEDTKPKF